MTAPVPPTEPEPTSPRAGAGRWSAVVVLTALVAAGVGYAATFIPAFRDTDRPWVVAIAFGACTLAPIGAAFWALLISPTLPSDEHVEDNVESGWLDKAMAGAALDTMGAAGIVLVALVFTSIEVPATWALSGVVLLLMVSTAGRYTFLSRRNG